ncbi:MAG: hypothetical protein AMXMBFR7_20250 [Planctomycetota bacterium]
MSAASGTNDLDLLIEDYVDGRLEGEQLSRFEARLAQEPDLRERVQTATQSIQVLRSVLTKVDPSPEFEYRVNNQIVSITQSNPGLIPAKRGTKRTVLTADDPDAKLLHDPQAKKESQRLMILAAVAALLFALAAAVIVFALVAR